MSNYLENMWDKAEAIPVDELRPGDTLILKGVNDTLQIREATEVDAREGWNLAPFRVIERAPQPEPKPRAVMAEYVRDPGAGRQVFAQTPSGQWESTKYHVDSGELVDPVEMVETPERDDLAKAIVRGMDFRRTGRGAPLPAGFHEAFAVLELLKGER